MRESRVVFAAAISALWIGCGGGRPEGLSPRSTRLLEPGEIGPLVLTDIEMPATGTIIGGHYQGTGYTIRQNTYSITETSRARWSLESRLRGERIMRLAGYFIESLGPATSDARLLRGVDYGLSGRVSSMEIRSTGSRQPFFMEAQIEVAWELIDLSGGGVIFGRSVRGTSRLTGPVDSAVGLAMDQSVERLLSDSTFRRALSLPHVQSEGEIARGWRALPAAADTIPLDQGDLNTSPDSTALARVAWGLVSLHGPGGAFYGTGLLLSRDGLALTTEHAIRMSRQGRDARARLSIGVERPIRLVRNDRGRNVALIQVQCPGDCPTVDWRAVPGVNPGAGVMIVGANGTTVSMSQGIMGGRWGVANGVTLQSDTGTAGDVIATPGSGRVIAMVGGPPGRPIALMLDEILRVLNVRVAETLRR